MSISQRNSVAAPRLFLEALEDRCTPAVVVGAVVNGVLTITLDNTTANNVVTIAEVSVAGGGVVSVNGGANIAGVTSIVVNSANNGGATDTVNYVGDGTNSANSFINGTLTINSNGNSILAVNIGAVTATRDVNIRGGVVINNPGALPMTLIVGHQTLHGRLQSQIGSLTVTSGAAFIGGGLGSGIYNTVVNGFVSITNNAAAGVSTFNVQASTIGSFFSFQGGNGTDNLFFGNVAAVNVGQNFAIDFRAALPGVYDNAFIGNAFISGGAVLIGGAGAQNFVLGGGIPNVINGNLTLNMGGGGTAGTPDIFVFDGALGGSLSHQGSGAEIFVLSAAANTTIGGFVSYNNPTDAIGSFVSLGTSGAGAPLGNGAPFTTIGTFLSILTGSANDLIGVSNTRIGQNFGLSTGAGADIVVLHSSNIIGRMFGDTGAGADILSFDGRAFNTAAVTDARPTFVGGLVNLTLGSEVDTVFFGDGFSNADQTQWSTAGGTINGQAPVGGNAFLNGPGAAIVELLASNPVLIF